MSLKINNLKVSLQGKEILNDINLNINKGDFISLLGPSGCGKSTLLKSISGLNELESGTITLLDKEIQNLPPEKRGTVIVFQDLRLFPHLTVEKNIAFSMNLNKIPKKEQKEVVKRLLKDVQLEGFENRKIREMSGGQLQRVALARALASKPNILLLDEPFSGLDEKLREEMGQLVKKLQRENNMTMILVTHDKNEALQLSDKIALMMHGDIIQYDKPYNMYTNPSSREVADYFGRNNYFSGKVQNNIFKCYDFQIKCNEEDGEYDAMIRPSSIKIDENKNDFEIKEITYLGDFLEVNLMKNNKEVLLKTSAETLSKNYLKINNKIGINIKEEDVCFFKI